MTSMTVSSRFAHVARRFLWLCSPLVPVICLFYLACAWVTGLSLFYWAFPFVIYIVIPLTDWLVGVDHTNPDPAHDQRLAKSLLYRVAVYAFVPTQMATVVVGALLVATRSPGALDTLGLALSVGAVNGVGFITAHDLVHQRGWLPQWLAKLSLAPTVYGHFVAEHVRGHHLQVATFPDPTSSRMGENFWRYLVRAIVTGVASAWRIEKQRLVRQGRGPWTLRNENLHAWLLTVLMFGGLALWLGPQVLPFLLLQAAYGVILLEVTNYIEHYGMLRQRLPDGSLERFTHAHAWDSNHLVCSLFIYQLQRHSDHHAHPGRPYQSLRWSPQAPQLPASYVSLMIVAYIPPWWFRLMDPKVASHHGGDLRRANVDPRHRERLMSRYQSVLA